MPPVVAGEAAAQLIRRKHPSSVPVIVHCRPKTNGLAKPSKLLFEKHRPGARLVLECRKRHPGASAEDDVFLVNTVAGDTQRWKVPEKLEIAEIDRLYASEDGFLHAELCPGAAAARSEVGGDILNEEAKLRATEEALRKAEARAKAAETKRLQLEPALKAVEDGLKTHIRDADIAAEILQLEKEKNEVRANRVAEVAAEVKQTQKDNRTALARAHAAESALAVKEDQLKAGQHTIEQLQKELQKLQAEIAAEKASASEKSRQHQDLVKIAEQEAAKAAISGWRLNAVESAACQAAERATAAEQRLKEVQDVVGDLRVRADIAERTVSEMRNELELREAGFSLVTEVSHCASVDEDGFVLL